MGSPNKMSSTDYDNDPQPEMAMRSQKPKIASDSFSFQRLLFVRDLGAVYIYLFTYLLNTYVFGTTTDRMTISTANLSFFGKNIDPQATVMFTTRSSAIDGRPCDAKACQG